MSSNFPVYCDLSLLTECSPWFQLSLRAFAVVELSPKITCGVSDCGAG